MSSLSAGLLALIVAAAMLGRTAPRSRSAAGRGARPPAAIARRRWTWARQTILTARHRRRARGAVAPADVAAWCDAIARRLRTGETLRQVLTTEHPSQVALRALTEPLRRALDSGTSVADAVAAAAAAPAPSALDLLWSVLGLAADYGGSAADPIDRAAAALRLRSADLHERSAQSAQARLSAHVLTAVPLLVLALLLATDPDVRRVVGHPSGWSLIGAGVVLNLSGWWWMRHIVARQSS